MGNALLIAHIIGAVLALLVTIGQLVICGRLRSAATTEALLRWNRLLVAAAVTLTLVVVLVMGAGFALLGGRWKPADPWVAGALAQALVLLVTAVAVVVPATQRVGDLAEAGLDEALAKGRDPVLLAVLAGHPALLIGIATLMVNKPPLAGAIEIPVIALVVGLLAWAAALGAARRRRWSAVRRALTWVAAVAVIVAGTAGYTAWRASASRLTGSVSMSSMGGHHMAGMGGGTTSLASLTVPANTKAPVKEYTLTARPERQAVGGRMREVWRLRNADGGTEIRVAQGTEVVVHVVNRLPVATSVHWHGVDVPASQDGVSGVTQDAIAPGKTYTYRFIADRAGTYWYHAHQDSVHQVRAGLFGALVVTPPGGTGAQVDQTVQLHTWKNGPTTLDGALPAIPPGRSVRLRVVNTDSYPRRVTLTGVPFRVAAIDGSEIAGAAPLTATELKIPGGGRYDLTFTSPAAGKAWLEVRNGVGHAAAAIGARSGTAPAPGKLTAFDLTRYGTHPSNVEVMKFSREYTVRMDAAYGWYNGDFGLHYTMNGALFPNGPMLMVRKGDLVKLTIVNRTHTDHPMHLHGHHFMVIEKDGRPLTGAPMVLDTLNVGPLETWTVAFRADNPGLWMFHCHNLSHASQGMDMMVGYEGVTTPYVIGGRGGNHPE